MVASDDPDTVEFDPGLDDPPTSSLGSAEVVAGMPEPQTEVSSSTASVEADREPASAREIGPGTILRHRYLIEKPLGIGGSSAIFSAVDRHRTQTPGAYGRVAVKVLHSKFRQDKARVFRLIREFRHMQRLTHAGIARVFDLDCDDGVWFITMELLEGQSLHRHLKDGLSHEEALAILTQCAEALAYAHDQGVMHGDLKPGNIFVAHDGSVRLLDFGSVPDQDEAATDSSPTHVAATLAYASPEMLEEKGIEPRDDLFSLGCVAYELFSDGQHPFDRKSSLLARRQNLKPAAGAAIPAPYFAIIARALSWERANRPASAREFLDALTAADLHSEPEHAATPPSPVAAPNPVLTEDLPRPRAQSALQPEAVPADPVRKSDVEDHPEESHPETDAAIHTIGLAELGSGPPDSVRRDSTPANAPTAMPPDKSRDAGKVTEAEDSPADRAAIERNFASFAGVVPDEWAGPGARLPARQPERQPERQPVRQPSISSKSAPSVANLVSPDFVSPKPAMPKVKVAQPDAAQIEPDELEASPYWVRRMALILLLAALVVAGILLSRPWEPAMSPPVRTAPASAAAANELITNIAPPAKAAEETTATDAPVAASAPPAAAVIARARPASPPSSLASFQSAIVQVGSSQQMAVVNVVRENSTAGAARIAWSIIADTAKPGIDYELPDPQFMRFNDGQRVRSLYIPIKHPAAGAAPREERRFAVKLQKVAGELAPGGISRIEVVIGAR